MSDLVSLPLEILERILSYNVTPWSISTCRRLYDAEEHLHESRLLYMGDLNHMVRQCRWEEVVYLVNMTNVYTRDIDSIYYILDEEKYLTGAKLVERLSLHIPKNEKRDLLRNLMTYEDTSVILPLLCYSDVYDGDGKYLVKYGWMSLVQVLLSEHGWSVDGVVRYAVKYGRVDIYDMIRDRPYTSVRELSVIAANNDRVNILEYMITREVEEEDLLSYVYDKTWSPITRSYIEDKGKDDSVLSTVSSGSETEDLELNVYC